MELKVKVNIIDDKGESVIGPGILELLEKIREFGSINRAAKEMKLSYVRAMRLLDGFEKNVGHIMLIRRSGGPGGGGTELTHFAQRYIENYKKFVKNIEELAYDEFKRFLDKIG